MKIKTTITLIVLLSIACTKESNKKIITSTSDDAAAAGTISIPLNDLGKGLYRGYMGGLYPNGSNAPEGIYASDLMKACKRVILLDTFGNSSANGKIVFISLGGSTGGHNMKALQVKTSGNPLTNPDLYLFNCNNGSGQASIGSIMNPKNVYWDHVTKVIKGAHSSYRQVQIIYLESEDSSTYIAWPGRPDTVRNMLDSCLRVFKQKFPNIKLVYVLGRTKTFGSKATWNREPSPYYFGWACKWAIEDQINGVRGTEYKGKNAVAPMLTWGFYQWADSLPRKTDGFYWRSTETADGLHATAQGQDTLSNRFQNFLLTDSTAKIWYGAH
jgi:hypothetical protein